jgi:hypothetical protein
MADTVEETVQTDNATETPAVPIGKAAFAAARQEIRARAQSADQGPDEESTPSTDDTPASQPAQEPAVADEPKETTPPEDALLTPEEVLKLSKSERKQYESMNKAFTTKTQKLAAERKQLAADRAELEALVAQLSADDQPADQETPVAAAPVDTSVQLPEEWKFLEPLLKPLLEAQAKQVRAEILREVNGELAPVKEAHAHSISQAVAAETNATIEQFTAAHKDWKQFEPAMLEVGQKLLPVQGAMTDFEYMELLYSTVKAKVTKADQTREIVNKINKVVENAEPMNQGVDSTRVEHVMPSGLDNSSKRFRAAAAAARRGERWTTTD